MRPRQRPRRRNVGTKRIEARAAVTVHAAAPVLHAVAHEEHAHQQQQRARHELGEQPVEQARRHKGHGELDPDRAQHRAEHGAPGVGARQLRAVGGHGACAGFVAQGGIVEADGEDVEGWADDGEQPGADEEGRLGDVHACYLQGCCEPGCDEGRADEVLGHLGLEVEGTGGDGEGRGHDGSNHGQGMLEAENDGEEKRDFIVKPIKRRRVAFVLFVQWPDVGRNEIEIVLRELVCILTAGFYDTNIITYPTFLR